MDASAGPVVLINLFEVPPGADEGFVAGWERARDFLAAQDGYRSTALHRSLGGEAEFRFVNVAGWASPAAFQAATSRPDFPGRDLPFPGHPGLYQVVAEDPPPPDDPGGVVLINSFEVPPGGRRRLPGCLGGQPGLPGHPARVPGHPPAPQPLSGGRLPVCQHRPLHQPAGLPDGHRPAPVPAGRRRHPAPRPSRPVRGRPTLTAGPLSR
jgi:heme oxygenase (mycobilin-producing)